MPVLCGTALKNKGVQAMLDAVVDYLPSPLDIPAPTAVSLKTDEPTQVTVADDEPFVALAFKIVADPFVGRLTYFRVYSGSLAAGSYVYNATKGQRERMGRLLQMHANHREDIERIYAGDICAAVGLKNTFTGDTLCRPGSSGAAGVDPVPDAGDRHRDRAEDARRPGQDGHRPQPPRRGRPDLQGAYR